MAEICREINLLKNNAVLHARRGFVDFDESERKRHLIRLWLTAHGDWADGDAFVQQGIPQKEGVASDADAIAQANAAAMAGRSIRNDDRTKTR